MKSKVLVIQGAVGYPDLVVRSYSYPRRRPRTAIRSEKGEKTHRTMHERYGTVGWTHSDRAELHNNAKSRRKLLIEEGYLSPQGERARK